MTSPTRRVSRERLILGITSLLASPFFASQPAFSNPDAYEGPSLSPQAASKVVHTIVDSPKARKILEPALACQASLPSSVPSQTI